ncbi:MAG: nucleotidyl transferase AbiEii/AbiGii toxin family protein [Rhodocyclaceae bacterium]|nr:nucleotidyl transferase AbiEii/AbiGii toxin family protein [Rhodocyclaceae bacterium]
MTVNPAEVRAAQEHFGFLRTEPIEKDWFVTQAVAALAGVDAAPFRLVFSGGTCLARAHKLVQRMSEDIDFKLVPLDTQPVSRSIRRKQLATLREQVTDALRRAGFAIEAAQIRSRNENHYIAYQLPYASGSGRGQVLRPTIQIELTYGPLCQPAVVLPVQSLLAEAFGRNAEVSAIDCVSVTQTAAEKLVAITRRTAMELAGVSRVPDPSLVRHLYDLHMMSDHIERAAALVLARDIALQDAGEFKNQYPAYHADIRGETRRALVAMQSGSTTRARYDSFVDAMVYGKRIAFDAAMATLAALVGGAWPENDT